MEGCTRWSGLTVMKTLWNKSTRGKGESCIEIGSDVSIEGLAGKLGIRPFGNPDQARLTT